MSQRNRSGRGSNRNNGSGHGEEVQLWDSAKEKFHELITNINNESDNLQDILELDKRAAAAQRNGGNPTSSDLNKLETHCRTGVRLSDLNSNNIKSLIEQLTILKGVQQAKEAASESVAATASGSRSTAASRRDAAARQDTTSSIYDFDAAGDSPVPSPISSSTRKFGDRGSNRDSMPPKADSAEPQGTSSAGGAAPSVNSAISAGAAAAAALSRGKVIFSKGDEVAFKPKQPKGETSTDWILGQVTQVQGEGKTRRYKVLDIEPDDMSKQKEYTSSATNMIPITGKAQAATLPNWEAGKIVLALYPQTTTFYKAEVMSADPDGKVNLRFEGENDSTTMQQVERRFVIEYRP
jgi:SAGA-associated factor 29